MDILKIQDLNNQLEAHLGRYQSLIDYLEREKKCLLALDLDGLLVTSQAKENMAKAIVEGMGPLTAAISEVGLMLGLGGQIPPTLPEIAALCPKPWDNRLNDGAMRLARLKNQILRENEQARLFVEEALNLVTGSINILTGADQIKGQGYRNDGTKERGVKKALPTKLSRAI
jgi:hypothetical protein